MDRIRLVPQKAAEPTEPGAVSSHEPPQSRAEDGSADRTERKMALTDSEDRNTEATSGSRTMAMVLPRSIGAKRLGLAVA